MSEAAEPQIQEMTTVEDLPHLEKWVAKKGFNPWAPQAFKTDEPLQTARELFQSFCVRRHRASVSKDRAAAWALFLAAQESVAVIQGLRSQLSTARAEISALQQGHQRELADVHSSLAAAHAEIASLRDAHEEENEVLSNRHEEEVTLLKTEKMDLMLAKSGLSTSAHDARVAAALATERAEQAESDLARVSTELTTAKKAARFLADQAKDRYVRANHEAYHKEITMLKAKLGSREAVIHAIHPGGLTDPDLPESEDVPAGRPPSLPPDSASVVPMRPISLKEQVTTESTPIIP
ncbi:UNVERIFIED_CONTAM: hypothetical protein K2H54_053070, partial [Gekko kuhli]